MTFDGKTIAAIVTALGLLFGEFREKKADDATRHDVSFGMIAYVDSKLDERDAQLAQQGKELAELRAEIKALRERKR